MWVPKLLISPVIIRIFCPKTTKFGPNLAFLSIAGSFGALLVGWLVVVARAVSRKTPIYFILTKQNRAFHPYYDRTQLLFSQLMRDQDTSTLREMFQFSSLVKNPLDQCSFLFEKMSIGKFNLQVSFSLGLFEMHFSFLLYIWVRVDCRPVSQQIYVL